MKVFLSYNRKNQGFVSHIAVQLKGLTIGLGDDVFFDQEKLESGDRWTQKIQDALENSDACVVFIGEQGIGNWQNKEVLTAINHLEANDGSFRIIPVIVPHNNREDVQKSFPWYLSDTQWIEFTSPSDADAFHKLTTTLLANIPAFAVPEGTQPYKGLAPFGVDDAAFFFGRTADVNRVFYYHLRLNESQFGKRFLAIIGNSGSGKSSFARAGLLASLQAGQFAGSRYWQQVTFMPGAKPLLNLAIVLEKAGIVPNATTFEGNALQNPDELYTRLGVWGKQLVLLIDQFEEVVTHRSPDKAKQEQESEVRKAFLANLTEAVKSSHLVCIITMRSDFYASFAPYPEFNHLLRHNNYTLTEIDANTNGVEWQRYIREIIRKPADLLKVEFENSVVNQIINDLQPINGVLPVLQLCLQQLWAVLKKPGRTDNKCKIVSQDYNSLARDRGIEGIIEEHADAVFDDLTERGTNAQRVELFKAIFIELVEITGSKEDVRRTISLTSLSNKLIPRFGEEAVISMLDELTSEKSRLIRIKGDENNQDAEKFVDIIHEVLIRKWDKLKGWINNRREAITYRQLIAIDIAQYDRKEGSLYTGRDLRTALNWQKNNPDLIDYRTREFITNSRTQKLSWIGGTVAILAIIMLSGLWYKFEYLPEHTGLAKYWKERNCELNEVHKLKILGLDELTNIYLFKNIDSLIIDAENQKFSQTHMDQLPNHLVYLSIKNAEIDEYLEFKSNDIRALELAGIVKIEALPNTTLLKNLRTLTLSSLSSLSSLRGLEKAPQLQTLTLSYLSSLSSLRWLEKTPQLQTLSLSGLSSLSRLQGLEKTPQLRTLTLSGLSSLLSLQGLEKIPQLRTLSLSNFDNLSSLRGLEKTPQLQNLTLSYLDSLSSLHGLEKMPQLQTLSLYRLDRLLSLQGLEKMPQLQTLSLTNLSSLSSLRWLEKMPQLRTLSLTGLDSLSNLQGLEKAPQLQTLTLSNLSDVSSLQCLEKTPQLHTLTLSYLDRLLSLQGLERIGKLKKLIINALRSSNLADTPVVMGISLDTLVMTNTSLSRIDTRTASWKANVLVYDIESAGEDKIVKMAINSPNTKFLNVTYLDNED